jgi:flagellar hook-basal body complex protein FliE
MRILGNQANPAFNLPTLRRTAPGGDTSKPFGDLLKDAVNEVNRLQDQADRLADQLASGQLNDVHQVMVAMEKASLALQLTIQVRNKVIEAYQEMMRTQV